MFVQLNLCLIFIPSFFGEYFKSPLPTIPFNFSPITPIEVFNLLNTLDLGSAKGEVGIETKILKECAEILSLPFTNVFNQCIKLNFMPVE